jgi:YceI-like domain
MTARATEIPGYRRAPGSSIPRPLTSVRRRTVMISKGRGCFDKFAGQILPTGDSAPVLRPVPVHLNSVNTGDQTRDDDLRSASVVNAAAWPTMSYKAPPASAAPAESSPNPGRDDRPRSHPASLAGLRGQPVSRPLPIAAPGRFLGEQRGQPPRLRACPVIPIAGLASVKAQMDVVATVKPRRPQIGRSGSPQLGHGQPPDQSRPRRTGGTHAGRRVVSLPA